VHEPRQYWDLQFDPDESVTDWGGRIRDTLEGAAREMSFADVPMGAFLSGGVDSSAVVAALSRGECSVNSFTVGFDERGYDERPYAREVAGLYGANHRERVVVPEDVDAALASLVWHFDEPFNDYSYLPTFYVCKTAREEITVALSGDGGDELFAGYPKYRRFALADDLARYLPNVARRAIGGAARRLPATSVLRAKIGQHTSDPVEMFTHAFMLGFGEDDLRAVARGELANCLRHYSSRDVIRSLLVQAPPDHVGFVNAMRYLDFKLTLAGDILVKVDRASMAVSLEVRPVFLHRDVIALAARIPPRLLATRRDVKRVLKRAVRPWLPGSILDRPKMGFAMPLQKWIEKDGGSVLTDGPDPHGADWFKPGTLEALVSAHPQTNHTARIHALSFLRQWSSLWRETPGGASACAAAAPSRRPGQAARPA
jgi:asparagine synthase (glutamine-hydrolysing)